MLGVDLRAAVVAKRDEKERANERAIGGVRAPWRQRRHSYSDKNQPHKWFSEDVKHSMI